MENINILDNYQASDFIKGFIEIREENGKILIRKENMIVAAGRNWIFNKLFNTATGTIDSIQFGSGQNPVVVSDTALQTPLSSDIIDVKYYEESNLFADFKKQTDTPNRKIVITAKVSLKPGASTSPFISELGLKIGSTLFSRVVFEPIQITSILSKKITYTVQF